MDTIEQVQQLMRVRIDELDQERRQLNDALSKLNGGGMAQQPARPAPKRRSAARSTKRARRGQRQTEFLAALESTPGAPMAEIAKSMGVKPQLLYPIAHRLEEAGKVKKNGSGYKATARQASKSNGGNPSA